MLVSFPDGYTSHSGIGGRVQSDSTRRTAPD